MALATQIALAAAYITLALAVGLIAPSFGVEQLYAWVGALAIAQLGAFIHLQTVRSRQTQLQHARMVALEQDVRDLAALVTKLSDEVESRPEQTSGNDGQQEEVVQEMRVLQTLLEQVVERGGRGEGATRKDISYDLEGGDSSQVERDDIADLDPDEFLKIVQSALKDNRVDLYLQPIVSLPARRTLHYECYSRVRDENGAVIFPRYFIPLVMKSNMIGTLDNLLLFRCIQLVRRLGDRRAKTRFFCNISSTSLLDRQFFPQFIEYMVAHKELADRLVFEFAYDDVIAMDGHVVDQLKTLGRHGYRFSADQVKTRSIDVPGLAGRYFNWLKIDHDVLMSKDGNLHPADFKELLWRNEISLIASKIEEEPTVLDILDLNIDYAQGFLFGEPRLSREEPKALEEV